MIIGLLKIDFEGHPFLPRPSFLIHHFIVYQHNIQNVSPFNKGSLRAKDCFMEDFA